MAVEMSADGTAVCRVADVESRRGRGPIVGNFVEEGAIASAAGVWSGSGVLGGLELTGLTAGPF